MHSKGKPAMSASQRKYVNKLAELPCVVCGARRGASRVQARRVVFQRACLPGVPSRPGWLARHKGSAGRSIVSAWLRLSTGPWVAC